MQTFLPYKDFGKTAKCLDYRRLGKQRVEIIGFCIPACLPKGPRDDKLRPYDD